MSKNKALSDFVSDISNAAVGDYLFLDSAGDRTIARQVLGSDISGFTAPYDSAGIVSLLDSSYVDTKMGGGSATSITGADVNSKLAALDNSVVPTTSMNLGSTTKKWRNIYTNKLSFGGISIDTNGLDGGNATLSGFTTPSDYVLVNNIVLSTPAAPTAIVSNSSYTSFLLKTDSTQTDAQVDASTNVFTITEAGNVTSTAFTPYHPKGYSVYFDGTDGTNASEGYLSLANSTNFGFGTDDFTIEAWVYFIERPPTSNGYRFIFSTMDLSDTIGVNFGTDTSGEITFTINQSGASDFTANSTGVRPEANQWMHLALVKNSGTVKIYQNGQQIGSDKSSTADTGSSRAAVIGAVYTNRNLYGPKAYISDLRVVKGNAVYTSSFTPPTERLTAITGTQLLTCHLPYFADGSTNNHSITVTGNTKTELFSSYDHVAYSPSDHGGSVYFDGSGDELNISPSASELVFGTDPYTVEFWINPLSAATGNHHIYGANYQSGFLVYYTSSKIAVNEYNVADKISYAETPELNTWTHYAFVREGTGTNQTKIYKNGKVVATGTDAKNWATNTSWTIGGNPNSAQDYNGHITDLRVVKGTAVYTADFTPPTEPLTAISGTQLLTCTNKNSIYDTANGSNFTINGDTTASTTQYKWSSSLYVDGTGDSLQFTIPNDLQAMGRSGTECTIECWVYLVSAPASGSYGTAMYSQGTQGSSGGSNVLSFEIQENQTVRALINGSYTSVTGCPISTGTVSTGQWTHLALVLYNQTWTIYINGTADGTGTGSYPSGTTHTTGYIGRVFYGANRTTEMYIEDLRISPGNARYTSNFTPPTAALEG